MGSSTSAQKLSGFRHPWVGIRGRNTIKAATMATRPNIATCVQNFIPLACSVLEAYQEFQVGALKSDF
jgi:hypothetical protein